MVRRINIINVFHDITDFRVQSNSLVHLEIQVDCSLQYLIVVDQVTDGTEDVEWTNQQEEQSRGDQDTKDALVKAFGLGTENLERVVPVTGPSNKHFPVVVKQLEELEDVETGLAENEVQKASDFTDEW